MGTLLASLALQAPALAAPQVSITKPASGSWTDNPTPSFSGSNNESLALLTLEIYSGTRAEGSALAKVSIIPTDPTWTASSPVALAQGRYTALAEEVNMSYASAKSAAVTFNVDTTPPAVSMGEVPTLANDATPQLSGTAGTAEGDLQTVTISVYKGSTATGSIVEHTTVTPSSGKWAYTSAHLADGTYTVQATQEDEAGNVGTSAARTFTIDTTPPALSLASPAEGALLATSSPSLRGASGQASGDQPVVEVKIYAGHGASGTPVQQLEPSAAEWSSGVTPQALANGEYTLVAEQSDQAGNVTRKTVYFKLDAPPPAVTLAIPNAVSLGSQLATAGTPSFTGTAGSSPQDGAVDVRIYAGASAQGTPVATVAGEVTDGAWNARVASALPSGTYTAAAEQQDAAFFGEDGVSAPVVFQVDATPPAPTLSTPATETVSAASVDISGTAGTATGDAPTVTVAVYAGAGVQAEALETVTVQATEGRWHTALAGLAPGTYTLLARQSNEVGVVGASLPVTITVTAAAGASATEAGAAAAAPSASSSASPPSASFEWFPHEPHVGEAVSVVSTSTDLASPLTSYAWALASGGSFEPGSGILHTSFASAGEQHVRLRVTDALGRSQVAEHVIAVSPAQQPLIEPFPVVRVAGSDYRASMRLELLSVRAPLGSTVRVTCRGGGCPAPAQTAYASRESGHTGLALVVFGRFERSLRAGAVLQVEISKAGEIGKYTRLQVRRGRLPRRVDMCLSVVGAPVACPR